MAKNRSEEMKLREEEQSECEIFGDVVKKVHNYERPQTLSDQPLEPSKDIDAFGYKVINTQTGEVLASRKNWLQAVEQVGEPFVYEEAGTPLLTHFPKARDLKTRAMEMLKTQSVAGIFGASEASDEDAFNALSDTDDSEVDDFNDAMSRTPYACDDKGVSNYEKALVQEQSELDEFRDFMSKKDNPLFQKVANMSLEDLERLLSSPNEPVADIPSQEPME